MGQACGHPPTGVPRDCGDADGFSKEDAEAVRFLLEKLDCGLSADLHYDYHGCLSLLVYSHRTISDRAFFLYRRLAGIHLVDVSGDVYLPVGSFASFIGAVTFIQRSVNGESRPLEPSSTWFSGNAREDGGLAADAPRGTRR
jgi:hypothetical protein